MREIIEQGMKEAGGDGESDPVGERQIGGSQGTEVGESDDRKGHAETGDGNENDANSRGCAKYTAQS
jgi:hypothetical protein